MTFSDPAVRKLLQRDFVCAWTNTEGDANAGASLAHAPNEPAGSCIRGNGEHNIQLLVLTPDLELLSVMAGYLAPADLVEELELARGVFATLNKKSRVPRAHRVKEAHAKFLKGLDKKRFDGPLADWKRRRVRKDHEFAAKHPLLKASAYRPEMLVGNAKTFFSSSSGGQPKETIGDKDALDLFKRIRKHDDETKPD